MTAAVEQRAVEIADYYVAFGRRFAEARVNQGLTQTRLARAFGVTRSNIANIEGGRTSVAAHNVVRYAEITQVDAGWLLTGMEPDGQPQPPKQPVTEAELGRVAEVVARVTRDVAQVAEWVGDARLAVVRHRDGAR